MGWFIGAGGCAGFKGGGAGCWASSAGTAGAAANVLKKRLRFISVSLLLLTARRQAPTFIEEARMRNFREIRAFLYLQYREITQPGHRIFAGIFPIVNGQAGVDHNIASRV